MHPSQQHSFDPNQAQSGNGQGQQGGGAAAAQRRLHIAHRRSPSEMTPLMMEQLALAQQIEMLQQQQQQIAATHQQYVNMGMIPQQQQLPTNFQQLQGQMQNLNVSPNPQAFQFQQQPMGSMGAQHLGIPMTGGMGVGSAHRRNQSAMPNMGMGPPPAPSSGASGSASFGDFSQFGGQQQQQQQQQQMRNENSAPRGRGGGAAGGGHARRHSLALPEAKKAAELAEAKRKTSGFQFPIPGAGGQSPSTSNRSVSPGQSAPTDTVQTPQTATLQTPQSASTPRGGFNMGRGHGRSQSMAVGGNRGMGASTRGGPSGFQFPPPQATNDGGDIGRRGSQGHGRTGSRNFEGNWRQQNNNNNNNNNNNMMQTPTINEPSEQNFGSFQMNQQQSGQQFQPGHRQRGSINAASMSSLGGFQYQPPPQLVQLPQGQVLMQQPTMFAGQPLNALQLAQLQAYQQAGIQPTSISQLTGQHNGPNFPGQQQQQRKTLFTPYLPQATLPALLADGQLVAGILRVNKKNRSDAYVTTADLDADIFICGSKDRNRALEGDLVAVELLDVDEVWAQKREKEEKKKRKDVTDARSGSITAVNDATTAPESSGETGLRRRGSLKQRPTQKKNDDVEVEGQSLLLMEEDEINDEQKPLYAGHVVAVIERIAGQMFSGTLGLLRPSSQATKEKQEAERREREGGNSTRPERPQERPKIVWFKPTDKRVPLIAIPTEQAPKDFVERHQEYSNKIFVACIKRWPITSLHPFGTLVEQLGEAGDLKVETDALLRDNNFGPDDFSDAVIKNVGYDDWSVAKDGEAALEGRRDFREDKTFTIDPNGSKELDDALHLKDLGDGIVEIGIHVADVAHFVKANSLVDREARKRGTGVYLINRTVNMLPPKLSQEVCCLSPGEERYTISVVLKVNAATGKVLDDETWVGKSVIKSDGKLAYDEVDAVINGSASSLSEDRKNQILMLHSITQKFRQARFGGDEAVIPALRLFYQLDDENVPVEHNIFLSSPSHEVIEELSHKTNAIIAEKIYAAMPDRALLRRQANPNPRRLQTFAERMANIGIEIDISTSAALQNSLFRIEDEDVRKGMETLVIKSMGRAKYFVPGKIPDDYLSHYALNLPLYTHFTYPSRRYADIVVQRQLESVLSDGSVEFTEDLENLAKTAETCNTKKDSARAAQEQSVHIEGCRMMAKESEKSGGDLISVGIVVCVYESAFDVLIPEWGFEKRVHCDQLPLKKAEFDKNSRLLELYWEKGVPSSAFVPEDEKPASGAAGRSVSQRGASHRPTASGVVEADRRNMNTGTIDSQDVDALFDDDEDNASEATDHTHNAGVALNGERGTHSGPPSPTRNGLGPVRSKSDSRVLDAAPEKQLTDKEKYLGLFTLREERGNYVQEVREMTRVPVLLRTDLGKSPPCLTIRSLNPFAL